MSKIAARPPRPGLVLAAALMAAIAMAPGAAATGTPPKRMSALTVYGDDACPKGDGDEIVVCAREPESERYRIPKRLRDKAVEETGARSWTDRVAGVEEASRPQRPNSCSTVGAAGQSGCTQAMLRQWFAERREAKAETSDIP